MSTKDQILRGMALAFFGSAYADQAEECGQPLRGEIMDQLPDEIDRAALHAAQTCYMDVQRANGQTDIVDLFKLAEQLSESVDNKYADRDLTPELFGHYLAMQAMGHGVGIESFGSLVRDVINVPYCEFGSYALERDTGVGNRTGIRIEREFGNWGRLE